MIRAWTLRLASALFAAILIGCGPDDTLWQWAPASNTTRPGLVSRPVDERPAANRTADASEVHTPASRTPTDDETGSLAQRIETTYAARFGPDPSIRQTNPGSPSASAQTTPPPVGQPAADPTRTPPAVKPDSPRHATAPRVTFAPVGVEQTATAAGPSPPNTHNPSPRPGKRPRVELLDVRPAAATKGTSDPGHTTMSANNASTAPPPTSDLNSLAALIGELEQNVRQHPEQLDSRLKLGLLYVVTGQQNRADSLAGSGDPIQTEFISVLLKTLTTSKDVIQQPDANPAPALLAVSNLQRILRQRSSVMIPKSAMVTRVRSFGDYDEVSPRRFRSGQPIKFFLYTEVANFRSEPTKGCPVSDRSN